MAKPFRQSQSLEIFRENPTITYKEIATSLGISYDAVKKSAQYLRAKGYLIKTKEGMKVLKEKPITQSYLKKDMIQSIIDIFMEDLPNIEDISEKIKMGELLLKLIIKL
ncbi:HTH domain-containing protein [Fusobacterium necrophorum]|uniref:HTH domain-containing protein n=1 Tax=Fusobacterium necrophorum TaxID=859 RepID=UPI00370E7871